MTRKEMIKTVMEAGFPYIITSAFVEVYKKYGCDNLYEGRPVSEELDDDMAFEGHMPIKHVSFKAKHPRLGTCVITLQKYIRKKNFYFKGEAYFRTYIFSEDGEVLDERGPFHEREVVSDNDSPEFIERFMKSDNITTPNPAHEFKYITTSPA